MGLFDRICSADSMIKFPALYKPSQNAEYFNVKVSFYFVEIIMLIKKDNLIIKHIQFIKL